MCRKRINKSAICSASGTSDAHYKASRKAHRDYLSDCHKAFLSKNLDRKWDAPLKYKTLTIWGKRMVVPIEVYESFTENKKEQDVQTV